MRDVVIRHLASLTQDGRELANYDFVNDPDNIIKSNSKTWPTLWSSIDNPSQFFITTFGTKIQQIAGNIAASVRSGATSSTSRAAKRNIRIIRDDDDEIPSGARMETE